jgi:4-hydroxybenzoate polyprenyltransferase/phosphoserine phosphatase
MDMVMAPGGTTLPAQRPRATGLAQSTVEALPAVEEPALVVDLDGTLVRTDLLIEALLMLVAHAPLTSLLVPLWLLRGRAAAKREIASRAKLEISSLPYREELCAYLRKEASRGRRLVLATANDELVATEVAQHLGFFERVIASDGVTNLKGTKKRDRLVREFGDRGFDYAGDARSDLDVWSSARHAIVVGGERLRAAAARRTTVQGRIESRAASGAPMLGALRAHHWLKNLLLFVPLFAAQRFNEPALIGPSLLAFASFCLLTSGLYVFNDLLDLGSDRRHPRKKLRPIPSGQLPLRQAVAMVPLLLAAAFAIGSYLPARFQAALALYCGLTLTYSLRLKQIVLLDVIVLASLYVLRILAGGAAVDTLVSRWLLASSMFTFLSLAMLKRFTEIVALRAATNGPVQVRGYRSSDATLLIAMGIASGYLAVFILAFYADTATAARFYARHGLLWLICPVFLYWISYLWLKAERNQMTFDPIVYAVRDRTSRVLVLIMLGLFVLAI